MNLTPINPFDSLCAECGKKMKVYKIARVGRPQIYCSEKCKKRAYRIRKGLPLVPPWKIENNTMIGGISKCNVMSCPNYNSIVPITGSLPDGCINGVCRQIS
jgi:hypothetical protein